MTDEHLGATRIAGHEACSKILLVGESNPYGGDPRYALYNEPANSAGGRLQRLIFGVGGRQWYLPMWRVNLCIGAFDREEATRRANELLGDAPWLTIVMLGKQVQRAFGVASTDGFGLSQYPLGMVSVSRTLIRIPHPSGRNTLWNDAANITAARDLMRRAAPTVPWGEV